MALSYIVSKCNYSDFGLSLHGLSFNAGFTFLKHFQPSMSVVISVKVLLHCESLVSPPYCTLFLNRNWQFLLLIIFCLILTWDCSVMLVFVRIMPHTISGLTYISVLSTRSPSKKGNQIKHNLVKQHYKFRSACPSWHSYGLCFLLSKALTPNYLSSLFWVLQRAETKGGN